MEEMTEAAERGEAERVADLGGTIYGGPLVLGDQVFQGSYSGALVAFDATTWTERWRATGLGKLHGAAAAAPDGETLYVAGRDGILRALSVETGAAIGCSASR